MPRTCVCEGPLHEGLWLTLPLPPLPLPPPPVPHGLRASLPPLLPFLRPAPTHSAVHRWAKAFQVRRRGALLTALAAQRCVAQAVGHWRRAFTFQRAAKAVVAGVGARVALRTQHRHLAAWHAAVARYVAVKERGGGGEDACALIGVAPGSRACVCSPQPPPPPVLLGCLRAASSRFHHPHAPPCTLLLVCRRVRLRYLAAVGLRRTNALRCARGLAAWRQGVALRWVSVWSSVIG
jgi:hypothetical protein